jgi:hypothetical protein
MHLTHISQKLKSMTISFSGPPIHPNFNEGGGPEKWFSPGHLSPPGLTGPPPPPPPPNTTYHPRGGLEYHLPLQNFPQKKTIFAQFDR